MLGLKLFIARRFLFSKKLHSVINIISLISIFSVAIITAALVIILSAINGFEDTIKSIMVPANIKNIACSTVFIPSILSPIRGIFPKRNKKSLALARL
jgi:ABC-type lipoprotein release transport system permease subunit